MWNRCGMVVRSIFGHPIAKNLNLLEQPLITVVIDEPDWIVPLAA